jgi:hypothetical protein
MQSLSVKNERNIPTFICEKGGMSRFMTTGNTIYLTGAIYKLHKGNQGKLTYFYFKDLVPKLMHKWILVTPIPHKSVSGDVLEFLNKSFIKQHSNLYIFKNKDYKITDGMPVIDNNVYRSDTNLAYTDDFNNTFVAPKKYTELLASDYGRIDVWQKQTTEVTNANSRYKNQFPIWQTSMNIRNYDRGNEGLAASTEYSSLDGISYSYGSAFKDLEQRNIDLYKKDSTYRG